MACFLIAAGAVHAQDACPPDAASLAPGDLTYSLSLDAERGEATTEVVASFRLLAAAEAQDVAMLVFADGIQILGPHPVQRVACGDEVRWRTRLERGEGRPLDLHASAHPSPLVPDAFGDAASPVPDDVEALRYAYDAADVATVAFGPHRDPPEGLASGAGRVVPAPMADAYLFDGAADDPVHVRVLEPGQERWSFHVWFGETWRRAGRFGITCLLDDRQFDAFGGRPLWFGSLRTGEAAILPAVTPALEPGWHQVRCLALDALFEGEDRGPAWPYVIRSTFVYRRP